VEDITFSAIIASSSAALKIGDEGAARLMLDIPATEMAEVLKMIAFGRGKRLSVTIEIKEETNGRPDD
jgi:hypothetical protein